MSGVSLEIIGKLMDLLLERLPDGSFLGVVGCNDVKGDPTLVWVVAHVYVNEFNDTLEAKMRRPRELFANYNSELLSLTAKDLIRSITATIMFRRTSLQSEG